MSSTVFFCERTYAVQ